MPLLIEKRMIFHACLVMFLAFFSGLIIGAVATGEIAGEMEDWKLAHMEALMNSLVLFAIVGCASKLSLSNAQAKIMSSCLILMAYCNVIFGFMRGMTGAPGFQFDGDLANNITTAAGMLGVPLAIIGFGIIIWAARK